MGLCGATSTNREDVVLGECDVAGEEEIVAVLAGHAASRCRCGGSGGCC